MAIKGEDISIVLSGGPANADPNLSLGGDPSNTPITGVLNNLFDNVAEGESLSGMTDYRCFYVFNDNDKDTFYSVKIFIALQTDGGADISIGIPFVAEAQKIIITGTVTGGYARFNFNGETFLMEGNESASLMAANLQHAINSETSIRGVSVAGSGGSGQYELTITFPPGRNHPLITLDDNALTGTTVDIFIQKLVDGGPINTIASPIDTEVTVPAGIQFAKPTDVMPIFMGDLKPLDGFPVWVRRIVAPDTAGVNDDGAIIRLTGKPFQTGESG